MALKKLRRALTVKECTLLRELCEYRIRSLERSISKATGSMWPQIWAGEIGLIEGLFENLTGFPLRQEGA